MLPEVLNKDYVKKEKIFREYCYIISKDKKNLIVTEIQNILETKLRDKELEDLNYLLILDNKGNLYKIENLEHDENFMLEIKLKKEEISLQEIKFLFVNNISKIINNKKDKIDDFLNNKIKTKIEQVNNKKELFELLLRERESSKKVDKIKIESINNIKKEKEEEFELKERLSIFMLLLLLSYVIFSSLFITIGLLCIIFMFILYIFVEKYRENDFKLKENGILVDIKDKIIKENDKKRIKFNKDAYFCSKNEYYKIINNKYNVKLTKIPEEDYFNELKELVDFRLNEYINLDNPFKELIEKEIENIKKIEIKKLSTILIEEE